jgi:alpha-galactosidase
MSSAPSRVGRKGLLAWLAAVVMILGLPVSANAALLAPTPYMGWNTYYGIGGYFNESMIKSAASSLISSGLARSGYKIVWLDFGWATGARDSSGQLIVDSTQWPDGMAGLTAWLHQQGLQAGIYTDAGNSGCNGQGVGSYGHYQQDANTFAAWGFDAVKVDFCGAGQQGFAPQPLYTQFAQALSNNAGQRPMILNVDNFWVPGQIDGRNPSFANSSYGNYAWAPQISQSWRTDTDIGFSKNIVFTNVLRNLDHDAAHPEAAGPGHWNDPDYLGPELGMTSTQAQSQFSMWAMLAAPLILGSDPRALSSTTISMLSNASVIAVDQDSLGAQGTLLAQSGSGQVWVKRLASGARAVALFNRGTSALRITTSASAVGLPAARRYHLLSLWTQQTTTTRGSISALVPANGVTLYRVTAG